MVQNTAKVPHGLPIKALTTTSQHREQDHHDQQHAHQRNAPRHWPHLRAHQIAKRPAIASGRQKQNGHVLNRPGKHDAGQDPQRARQIPHLSGEDRSDERSRAGNGSEVMAEQHVAVGRHIIEGIIVSISRGLSSGIDAQHLAGDEQGIEAKGDEVNAKGGDDQPCGADGLAAVQRNDTKRDRAQGGNPRPEQLGLNAISSGDRGVHSFPPTSRFDPIQT
jgi:hypothetical protein